MRRPVPLGAWPLLDEVFVRAAFTFPFFAFPAFPLLLAFTAFPATALWSGWTRTWDVNGVLFQAPVALVCPSGINRAHVRSRTLARLEVSAEFPAAPVGDKLSSIFGGQIIATTSAGVATRSAGPSLCLGSRRTCSGSLTRIAPRHGLVPYRT